MESTNSAIIKNLVSDYLKIDDTDTSKSQPIVFDKSLYNQEEKDGGFNNQTLTRLDKHKLDLILIGDNPGKNELKHNEYFYSKGAAGKIARMFLELAQFRHQNNNFQHLILNKTPYHSTRTAKLTITPSVNESITSLIEALNKLAILNPELIILIVGHYKKNQLNQNFYTQLFDHSNQHLLPKLRFAKHFSNGHFFHQWIKHELIAQKDLIKPTLNSILNMVHEESIQKINVDFNLQFNLMETIQQLNHIFNEAVINLKNNHITTETTDKISQLSNISTKYSGLILNFDEEFNRDESIFFQFEKKDLKYLNTLQKQLQELSIKISESVKQKDFEKASQFLGQKKNIASQIKEQVLSMNNLNQVFNLFKGCVLVVTPHDSIKDVIIKRYWKNLSRETL